MGYISEEEFNSRLKEIKKNNISKERKRKLREEKAKYMPKFKIETSKLIMLYLIILSNVIIVFAMKAMWTFGDLSYLGVLISEVAAQILAYGIYCLKAYHGKKQEEQIKLEKEKLYENYNINLEANLDEDEALG